MNSLSEKEKLILWIEEGQRNIEMACRLIENGKPGEALGLMHDELSRSYGVSNMAKLNISDSEKLVIWLGEIIKTLRWAAISIEQDDIGKAYSLIHSAEAQAESQLNKLLAEIAEQKDIEREKSTIDFSFDFRRREKPNEKHSEH